ncbi:MAG TPA: delta-60 repeat domain-containing protein, partial [Actinomycetota bacterium]|nr:delta-60 repeat domain-containing protein [Actinomycetota bacterium]
MTVRWFRVAVVSLLAVLVLVAMPIGASANPGDLDPSYGGGDGQVTTAFPDGAAYVNAAALQSDGKLVVAGDVQRSSNDSVFALARYTVNGALDHSFGNEGRVETDFTAGEDHIRGVFVAKDGSITVAGSASDRLAAARYHPNGTLDHGFGGDGKVTVNVGTGDDVAYAIGRSKGGKV